jgi:hypothetical protein
MPTLAKSTTNVFRKPQSSRRNHVNADASPSHQLSLASATTRSVASTTRSRNRWPPTATALATSSIVADRIMLQTVTKRRTKKNMMPLVEPLSSELRLTLEQAALRAREAGLQGDAQLEQSEHQIRESSTDYISFISQSESTLGRCSAADFANYRSWDERRFRGISSSTPGINSRSGMTRFGENTNDTTNVSNIDLEGARRVHPDFDVYSDINLARKMDSIHVDEDMQTNEDEDEAYDKFFDDLFNERRPDLPSPVSHSQSPNSHSSPGLDGDGDNPQGDDDDRVSFIGFASDSDLENQFHSSEQKDDVVTVFEAGDGSLDAWGTAGWHNDAKVGLAWGSQSLEWDSGTTERPAYPGRPVVGEAAKRMITHHLGLKYSTTLPSIPVQDPNPLASQSTSIPLVLPTPGRSQFQSPASPTWSDPSLEYMDTPSPIGSPSSVSPPSSPPLLPSPIPVPCFVDQRKGEEEKEGMIEISVHDINNIASITITEPVEEVEDKHIDSTLGLHLESDSESEWMGWDENQVYQHLDQDEQQDILDEGEDAKIMSPSEKPDWSAWNGFQDNVPCTIPDADAHPSSFDCDGNDDGEAENEGKSRERNMSTPASLTSTTGENDPFTASCLDSESIDMSEDKDVDLNKNEDEGSSGSFVIDLGNNLNDGNEREKSRSKSKRKILSAEMREEVFRLGAM